MRGECHRSAADDGLVSRSVRRPVFPRLSPRTSDFSRSNGSLTREAQLRNMPSESTLDLRLLGVMEASASSATGDRRLSKGKPVALLAYLSLAPGRRASRERLATLLWSEGTSENARQNLRQTLWYLKRRLGDVIIADDDTVALAAGVTSDVERFGTAAGADRFSDAVAEYRGDFSPDFAAPGAAAFEEWAELERRRLRATYVGCAEAMSRTLLSAGHASDAVRVARQVRELAPDDPSSWRLLLECLIAARDPLGITAAVAQLEGEIARDDIDPDAAIKSLLRAAKKVSGNGDVEVNGSESTEQSLVPDLIGREAEFRELVDAWEGARRGRGRTLLLTGAAGLGKTRLLADFAARVASTRGRAVQVRAHPGNRTIVGSLAAQIGEALAALPGSAAISPGSASVLVALSPLLASTFPGAEPDRASGEDALRRRAAALGDLLGVLCEAAPVALLVDDAHWADAESMRIVGALRARVDGARALLVIASRIPDDLRLHVGNVEEIALKPLDVAGVAEFVGRLAALPTDSWSRGLVPRLHEVTHGIPLLLIETLQRLVESGALARRDGQWSAASAESLEAAMPPGSALQARLGTLSAPERTALIRLATMGRPVPTDQMRADDEVRDWPSVLGELERRSFVTQSEKRVNAWHDEIARGVLDLAAPEERLRAHAWVSDQLASHAAALPEFKLAMLHALRAADDERVRSVWHASLRFARAHGDQRGARLVAGDVFPAEMHDSKRVQLVRSAPIGLRIERVWRIALVAAVFVLVALGISVATSVGPSQVVRVFLGHDTDAGSVWLLELPLEGTWRVNEPIVARAVNAAESPWRGRNMRNSASPLPDGEGWIAQQSFGDSATDELVQIAPNGDVARLSSAPGDDNAPTASPDGRQLVFSTRRYDRDDHEADLAIYDRSTRRTTRLTESAEDELAPIWSPDGTRIAFQRYYQTLDREPETCVRSVDGVDEKCDWAGLPELAAPIAWMEASTLLVQVASTNELYRVDVYTGVADAVGRPSGSMRTLLGGAFLICSCIEGSSQQIQTMIAPLSSPMALRSVTDGSRRLSPRSFAVEQPVAAGRYLDGLVFESSELEVALDGAKAVLVSGVDAFGLQTQVHALHFTSADTGMLRVSPDGTVRPIATGRAWIRVSAGGWRTDSVPVRIMPATSQVLVDEEWRGSFAPSWRPFGDPLPTIDVVNGRRVFSPNGDGVYPSGAYLVRSLPTERGLGVRFEAQLPVTRRKFQTIGAGFFSEPPLDALTSWDHVSGAGPLPGRGMCSTSFPAGEGEFGTRRFGLHSEPSGTAYSIGAPPADFYSARWHTIELQYTTDGRCALRVDGVEVVKSERPASVPTTVRFAITGHSKGARILVRGVEIWEGVRGEQREP